MTFKKYIISLILIIMISSNADTSGFSALSIGDIETSLSGTTGAAFKDSLIMKNHNFASWTSAANTSFSFSVSYYFHELEDSQGSVSNFDRFIFEDINFALPFGKGNVFGLAYYPVSITDISNVTEEDQAVSESFENTYLETFENKVGSISNISLIYGREMGFASFAVNTSFKIGNYDLFRKYKYTSYVSYPEVTDWEKYFERTDKTQLFHLTAGAGFLTDLPGNVRIGGTLSVPFYSYGRKIFELNETNSYGFISREIEDIEKDIDVEWPLEFSGGINYNFRRIDFSYDISVKKFKGLDTGIGSEPVSDHSRHTLGISYKPGNRRYDPYYEKIRYSAYLGYEKRPYQYPEGKDISDISATLGFDLPFNKDMTDIELRLGYARSGSLDDNTMKDSYYKIQVIFHSSDRWWLKKQRYTD